MLAGKLTEEDEEDLEQELLELQEEQVVTLFSPPPFPPRIGRVISLRVTNLG